MRAVPLEMQARLDGGATTLCRCWRVERRDGEVMGFTDHDGDVAFEGTLFRAASGLDAGALQAGTGLAVDNGQAVGALSSAAISEADIREGRFDRARVVQWLVDWTRPDLRLVMFAGEFGEIRRADGLFEVELRGLAEALNVPVGRRMLRTCDRVLGDARCGVDAAAYSVEAQVAEGSAGAVVEIDGDVAGFAPDWFAHGRLEWVDGRNVGTAQSVKADRQVAGGRQVELWQEPPAGIAVGDRFRLVAGCDKRAETCREKFGNFLNFRGFPHIPGEDWVTAYPKAGGRHDGRSRRDG